MSDRKAAYLEFREAKIKLAPSCGFQVDLRAVNPALKEFVRDVVVWGCRMGRAGFFSAFGLHKTCTQLEVMRQVGIHRPGTYRLIVIPLGVKQEFFADAQAFFTGEYSVTLKFIRSTEEIEGPEHIYLTNYESVREGKIDVSRFGAGSLDEAAVLRSAGSKTFSQFLFGPFKDIPLRWVATATPSPSEVIELLGYAQFLDVMSFSEAKTRFFQRDSKKADHLTLHPHKEEEFWLWVASWGLFLQKPSDLGYSDDDYQLPDIEVCWHEVPTDHTTAGKDQRGQGLLIKSDRLGISQASREKRESMGARMAKAMELRDIEPDAHRIFWHDLEDERKALEKLIPGIVTVHGSGTSPKELAKREQKILDFRSGGIQEFGAKPCMLGPGCNFQHHCHWAIFVGIGFKFHDFIQAVHRIQRFQQRHQVRIDLIYTEAERPVRAELERRWAQDRAQRQRMAEIIQEYGLSEMAMRSTLTDVRPVERMEAEGEGWAVARNDTVLELWEYGIPNSLDAVLTSIPFGNQYKYCNLLEDFGQTEDLDHFFAQMDFLTPSLYEALRPGRVLGVHVKDRVKDGGMIGQSYQTVEPFHAHTLLHYKKHGFEYMGMWTIVTDVVKENNQTYRLGHSRMLEDMSRMSWGMPEYVLLFRKNPSDHSKGYADARVPKDPAHWNLARWQIEANAFARSNGNRLLMPEDFHGLSCKKIFRLWRNYAATHVYDFEQHVAIGEELARREKLRRDFSLIPVPSWHPDVMTDIMRAKTLNSRQVQRDRAKHLCPFQIDIVDRFIDRFTNPGETIFDPFMGVGTVPVRAVKMGRIGMGCELSDQYFQDACYYLRKAEQEKPVPTLFDLLEVEGEDVDDLPAELDEVVA